MGTLTKLPSLGAVWCNDSPSVMCTWLVGVAVAKLALMGWEIPISVSAVWDMNSPQLVCTCIVGVAVLDPSLMGKVEAYWIR